MDMPDLLRALNLSDDPLREIESVPDTDNEYKKGLKGILADLASGNIAPEDAKKRIRELNI